MNKILHIALWASTAFDLSTTLRHGVQSREGNPLLGQRRSQQVAVMAGTTALSTFALSRLAHSHPQRAEAIVAGISSIHFAAGVHNIKLRKER